MNQIRICVVAVYASDFVSPDLVLPPSRQHNRYGNSLCCFCELSAPSQTVPLIPIHGLNRNSFMLIFIDDTHLRTSDWPVGRG